MLLSGMFWTNYHYSATYNVGDRNCAPVQYFPELGVTKDMRIASNYKNSIIGGGGLLYYDLAPIVKNIIERSEKSVIWGLGSNSYDINDLSYPKEFRKCDLVGVRDYKTDYEWVPCASCLSDSFDWLYEEKHSFVVYRHICKGQDFGHRYPSMGNGEKNLHDVIKFLGSGNCVITDTYHGVYWATLLGKKVLCLNPFSSRFNFMRHPPTFIKSIDDVKAAYNDANSYPTALFECRTANNQFHNKVKAL